MSTTPRTDAARGFHDMETAVDAEEMAKLETELAEARAEAQKSAGEWATLMSDVHDYFADEKADRSRGRVTLLLTLLGSLRTQRDEARAEVERLREDKARLDWLNSHPIRTEIKGGSEDGHPGIFWGLGSHGGTLREALDTVRKGKA
jgi:hypothetical protein